MASRKSSSQGDENTKEKIFARIADNVYPEHLRKFATTLLGIQDAKFSQITDGHRNWEKCHQVRKVSHIFTNKTPYF